MLCEKEINFKDKSLIVFRQYWKLFLSVHKSHLQYCGILYVGETDVCVCVCVCVYVICTKVIRIAPDIAIRLASGSCTLALIRMDYLVQGQCPGQRTVFPGYSRGVSTVRDIVGYTRDTQNNNKPLFIDCLHEIFVLVFISS